jgi:hypothetical protein
VSDKETEIMLVSETVAQSWLKDGSGTGWFLDSSALQWSGAFVGFLTLALRSSGKVPRLTIAEARERLDELESR